MTTSNSSSVKPAVHPVWRRGSIGKSWEITAVSEVAIICYWIVRRGKIMKRRCDLAANMHTPRADMRGMRIDGKSSVEFHSHFLLCVRGTQDAGDACMIVKAQGCHALTAVGFSTLASCRCPLSKHDHVLGHNASPILFVATVTCDVTRIPYEDW